MILLASGAGQLNLAGGCALIAHGLIDRDTKDLDAFTTAMSADLDGLFGQAAGAFRAAGYTVTDTTRSPGMRRMEVLRQPRQRVGRPAKAVEIEMCTDYRALPAVASRLGPLLDPLELAANKILAIYDRTRPRDADDLARLIPRLGFGPMLTLADREQVSPLDREQLAEGFRQFRRVPDHRFPFPEGAAAVKRYMALIAVSLQRGTVLRSRGPYAHTITTGQSAEPLTPPDSSLSI